MNRPSDYDLGANERFYGDMEARGWRLVKLGRHFSRFASAEPSRARYRIEVYAPDFLETDSELSEGQLAVYEDCGWEYVTGRWMFHIFRAPEGSTAPEFYSDPRQQAETLRKLRRDTLWSWALWGLLLVLEPLLIGLLKGSPELSRAQAFQVFVLAPGLFLGLSLFVLWALYHHARDTWLITSTYRRLKRGIPLDHNPQRGHTVHRAVNAALWVLILLCALLAAVQFFSVRRTPLPEEADGPYLLLRDLGCEGERVPFMHRESEVTAVRSPLAWNWDTAEYLTAAEGGDWIYHMYQDVYRLPSRNMAMRMARALMAADPLSLTYTPIPPEGLDAAWSTHGIGLVVVKGNMAARITYLDGSHRTFDDQAICAALAERWAG